jgi:hypothetical protein
MASFESHRKFGLALIAGLAVLSLLAPCADAQQQASGFAVERLYQSAPGGGWFVMDDLNISGGLGGALSISSGYAHNPLTVASPDGKQRLGLVTQQAFIDIGGAVTYNRFRAYLNLPTPIFGTGTIGLYQFTAPSVSLGTTPDTLSDSRLGLDVRLLGEPGSLLRIGAGAQLIIPSGNRSDYVTDARYRGMFRFLAAGDSGAFTYAGQLGIHVRPLNDAPIPGSPNGNEFLYGISGGRRFSVANNWIAIAGPEIYGETAFHSFFSGETGTEALLTGRLEHTGTGRNLRMKLSIGHVLYKTSATHNGESSSG